MTDHLTARLASSLHVSSSTDTQNAAGSYQTGLENSRGFYRLQDPMGSPHSLQRPEQQAQHHPASIVSSEPRKYRKAARNRSNPTTPVSSHPPSPSPGFLSHASGDDLFSSFSSTSSPFVMSAPSSGTSFESFAQNTASSNIFLDPRRSSQSSGLLLRREGRTGQQFLRSSAHHYLAMATRLALFHRIVSTTKCTSTQSKDMRAWIMEQASKRGYQNLQAFESMMISNAKVLVAALGSLGDGFSQIVNQQSFSHMPTQSQDQEIAVYNTIQSTVDTILESAQWLCGPDFEMGINRICPQWSVHEGSIEQIVHYVQVVESMRETLSGRFHHPQDLSEDLTRSQEVIDYQRTLFGEALRNHGLEWRALGLPAMEELIQGTQDWILNLAKMLTIKIRGEVNLALESAVHTQSTSSPSEMEMEMMDDDEGSLSMGRSVTEAMDLVLQGALLSRSCLELAGKICPMLVTAWVELTSQYCTFALAKRKEHVLKTSKASVGHIRKLASPGSPSLVASLRRQQQHQHHPPTSLSRRVCLKTMELFENVSRLLQCVMEMHEEEEYDGQGSGTSVDGFGGQSEHDEHSTCQGASGTSSDQDEAMDIMSGSPSSVSLHSDNTSYQHHHQQRLPRAAIQNQRRTPVDPTLLQRRIAMESLSSVLVETGLELCESMAEILGCGYQSTSTFSSPSTSLPAIPSSMAPAPFNGFGDTTFLTSSWTPSFGTVSLPSGSTMMSSSARAAAAITSLTVFAGSGAMASGTGGIGLIYVQFVVRFMSKIIEFAGLDPHQEQRLLRIHTSLQNLELSLSSS
ncbi:hypothetical protein BC939DRAFT_470862 [Gamsiella multidivaricata]|uniref:uncharacterized protein n=1 Tax=Gamsiella multidivaricata TaxID=101098 RepID=UPI00222040A6|nr:uncharacterized protein BC939DRAFT_470862 [Gamsiella multidivaricata]KAI7815955.1 hypothetical protein BC939DRAFT_470862 [Gamsiella multidivaricata]